MSWHYYLRIISSTSWAYSSLSSTLSVVSTLLYHGSYRVLDPYRPFWIFMVGFRWQLVPRLPVPVPRSPFPVPRSPFPVPRFSNIHLYLTHERSHITLVVAAVYKCLALSRELKKRWRRPQRERKKSNRFILAKQQLCTFITFFCSLLAVVARLQRESA